MFCVAAVEIVTAALAGPDAAMAANAASAADLLIIFPNPLNDSFPHGDLSPFFHPVGARVPSAI
jgi:hypothetical protein